MPIELSGMNEMLQKLEKMGKNVDKVKEKALKAGAEKIRKPIADLAPRSKIPHEHMADSIIISEVKKDTGGNEFVEVGPEKSKFWAKFNEFGTVKMKAHPFVEPGFLQGKKEALEAIAEVVKGEIND